MPVFDLFAIRWFAEFLGAYETADVIRPSAEEIERYRGRLPDMLLAFWAEHGWCSWSQGQYWVCDPARVQPVIEHVFKGDPELDPSRMTGFGYTAFGEVDIWHGDSTIRLDLLMNKVRIDAPEIDERSGRRWTDEVLMGLRLTNRLAPAIPPWEDAKQRNMMPQALERLGRLGWGEIYGFVPALSLGGTNSVAKLHKQPLVEHLVLLAAVEPPILYDYEPPADGQGGFGTVTPGRRIGSQ